jgi:hypothetical protein
VLAALVAPTASSACRRTRRPGDVELPRRLPGGIARLRADPELIIALEPDLVCVRGYTRRTRCACWSAPA